MSDSYDDNDKLVEWDDKYAIGIPLIDEQHKQLIQLTNDLYKACRDGTEAANAQFKEAIRGTVDYIKYHFSAEEKMLENIKYPELTAHKRQHESLVKSILVDVKNFEEGKKFVPNAFVRELKDWILTHIAVMDVRYAQYMKVTRHKI
ncbi:MAG: bacteriohemerythrin [Treponema sp.]|jgi:hemerythrin|nr:bacteriohemerythrin [Treponema sp.]